MRYETVPLSMKVPSLPGIIVPSNSIGPSRLPASVTRELLLPTLSSYPPLRPVLAAALNIDMVSLQKKGLSAGLPHITTRVIPVPSSTAIFLTEEEDPSFVLKDFQGETPVIRPLIEYIPPSATDE